MRSSAPTTDRPWKASAASSGLCPGWNLLLDRSLPVWSHAPFSPPPEKPHVPTPERVTVPVSRRFRLRPRRGVDRFLELRTVGSAATLRSPCPWGTFFLLSSAPEFIKVGQVASRCLKQDVTVCKHAVSMCRGLRRALPAPTAHSPRPCRGLPRQRRAGCRQPPARTSARAGRCPAPQLCA